MRTSTRLSPSHAARASLCSVSAIALALALAACSPKEETAATPDTAAASSAPSTSSDSSVSSDLNKGLNQAAESASSAGSTAAVALDDTGITTKIKAALVQDSELSALDVKVETHGGAVTLSGTAPTAQAKERAEGLAKGVEGVQRVSNNLEVKAGS